MKRIDKHVYLTSDQIKRVEESGAKKGMGFSWRYCFGCCNMRRFQLLSQRAKV